MSINEEHFPLPKDLMPEIWFNDERMNVKFGEFRKRSVNPQDWDSKFEFWQSMINNYLSHNKQCTFTISQLSTIFKRKGRIPLCLPALIEELHKKGELMLLDSFIEALNSTWVSWAVNLMVKKPISWSFSKLKNYLITDVINPEVKYIHIAVIKELADEIMSLANDEEELIISVPEITKKCHEKIGNKNLTEENVKLALLWLSRLNKGGFNVHHHSDKRNCLVKLSPSGIQNLTEAEESLFKMKENERVLLGKIENLEIERNHILVKAKSAVNGGLKEVAKTHIRKKRELDKRIEKHAGALQNLQTLISSIHDAHSHNEILDAYKEGRDILKGYGLNESIVRDTMDDMIEAVGEVQDIQSTLSENIKINDSDIDFEDELNEIMNSSSNNTTFPKIPDSDLPELEKELHSLLLEDSSTPQKSSKTLSSQVKLPAL